MTTSMPLPGTATTPGLVVGNNKFSEQQMKDWYASTGGDPNKIAADAVANNANADQIAQAIAWGSGKGPEYNGTGGSSAVKGYVKDNLADYDWDANGTLVKRAAASFEPTSSTAAPASSFNPPSQTSPSFDPSRAALKVNPETDTVEGRLNKLLSSGNPYLEAGRTEGANYAASRGFQNSSLGAEAGELARIKAALPIAQQDADLYGKGALSTQQGIMTSMLEAQDAAQKSSLMREESGYRLIEQQAADAAANWRSQLAADTEISKADAEFSAQDRESLTKYVNETTQQMEIQYREIMTDPDLSEEVKQQLVLVLGNMHQSNLQLAAALHNVQLDWSVSNIAAATPKTEAPEAQIPLEPQEPVADQRLGY